MLSVGVSLDKNILAAQGFIRLGHIIDKMDTIRYLPAVSSPVRLLSAAHFTVIENTSPKLPTYL